MRTGGALLPASIKRAAFPCVDDAMRRSPKEKNLIFGSIARVGLYDGAGAVEDEQRRRGRTPEIGKVGGNKWEHVEGSLGGGRRNGPPASSVNYSAHMGGKRLNGHGRAPRGFGPRSS